MSDPVPNNLPLQLTSFIGREKEIAKAKRLLGATRLLTFTGAGGAGKTRLALQVAADLLATFDDGAWFVDLAPLSDSSLIPQTIATVFDLRESGAISVTDILKNSLRAKKLVLVLDNCEHLIQACSELCDALLRACPGLKILATSREALRISGETAFRVPSLSLAGSQDLIVLDKLAQSEAIQLFAERATATGADFHLTVANAPAIAQICKRLDGMPLAIELAAAWVKSLSVEQIAARLDDSFRLLMGGSRTAPTRQQTLSATIDWSYALLSDEERVLLNRLSVFAGGWSLEAAESICAGEGIESRKVIDLLARLIDQSLVVAEEYNDETRYRMLETIRQYAREKLTQSGEEEKTRDRHLDFFFRFIEEADPKLRGADETIWLERLEREHSNLRVAFECALSKDDPDLGLKFIFGLRWFLWVSGYLREGKELAGRAMARSQNASKSARAKGLLTFAFFITGPGQYEQVEMNLKESFTLYRELGDEAGTGLAQHYLAMSAFWQADYIESKKLSEENLALWRKLGNKWWIATTLHNLGAALRDAPNPSKAATLFEEALAIWQEIGNKRGLSRTLGALAVVAKQQGDYKRAVTLNIQALSVLLEIRDRWSFAQFLRIASTSIASELGEFERAARFLGAAEALYDSIGYELQTAERITQERIMAPIRAALDETKLHAAWNEGRAMSMQQAIEDVERVGLKEQATETAATYPAGLTEREVEVLRWVTRGLKDTEIAKQLVVSPRTVHAHLQSIYSKLDVTTRTAAANAARELNIL